MDMTDSVNCCFLGLPMHNRQIAGMERLAIALGAVLELPLQRPAKACDDQAVSTFAGCCVIVILNSALTDSLMGTSENGSGMGVWGKGMLPCNVSH